MPPLETMPGERVRNLAHPVVLKGVSRTYRLDSVDVPALTDINLVILPNRFTVLSGPSGSGKTTLLNLIGCIDRPDKGTIMVGGRPVQTMEDDALSDFRAHQLGFIFQNFNLLPVLTAFENVEYPLVLTGMPADKRRARVAKLLEAVGLADRAGNRPGQLSGGQRQRVAIARALANTPHVLLADEPTAALDSQRAKQVMELFAKIAHEQDAGVIVVTHDHRFLDVFDTVYELEDGVLRRRGRTL